MNQAFLDYFRCSQSHVEFGLANGVEGGAGQPGYFQFGGNLCFGSPTGVAPAANSEDALQDAMPRVSVDGARCVLPFDLNDVVTNLRQERYVAKASEDAFWKKIVRGAYYLARPYMPVKVRRHAQRLWLKGWDRKRFPSWPVDCTVDQLLQRTMALLLQASGAKSIPFIWFWPEGKSSCAIVTHDVEELAGLRFCSALMDIDESFDIKSSFQLIPAARYTVSSADLKMFQSREFEVNVHDLKHDGRLFREDKQFQERAEKINEYATRFGSKGFRSGVLYRNLDWFQAFTFSYDMSVPNVAHLDPQAGGCCTVMPFYIGSILELPLTTIQDYPLFNVLGSYSAALWKQQIEIIRKHHGLMSFNIHPDYLNSPRAIGVYKELLMELAQLRSQKDVWIPLPGEVDTWWRQRSRMQLRQDGSQWRIEGPGAERARVAYACLDGDSVRYSIN